MWHGAGHGKVPYRKRTVPADMSLLRPVDWQQLILFDMPRDLAAGLHPGFPPPPDPAREAAFNQFVADHASRYGWRTGKTETVKRAIRILLGIQDTPGARFRRSDVALLSRIKHSAQVVADVLDTAGILDDDRQPAIVRWFHTTIAELPAPMRAELNVWFDVLHNGSTTTPRMQPRKDQTINTKLRWAMPALRQWARTYESLREVGRDDILAVLPRPACPGQRCCRDYGRSSPCSRAASWSSSTRRHESRSTSPSPQPRHRSTWTAPRAT